MKLLTMMLKELIEIIEILQFRFQTWNEFAKSNVSSMTIFDIIAVICVKGSEEDGTRYQCYS